MIVPDYQLSLAIGKEGQNARLAARLTGWRVDIKSETQLAEEEAYANQDWAEGEWVENEAGEMVWKPAEGGEGLTAEAWSHGDDAPKSKRDRWRRGPGEGADGPRRGELESRSAGDRGRQRRRAGAPSRADAPRRRRPRDRQRGDGIGQTPQRTCIGCRRVAPPTSSIGGRPPRWRARAGAHAPGRGAWLCVGSLACFDARGPHGTRSRERCARRGIRGCWPRFVPRW